MDSSGHYECIICSTTTGQDVSKLYEKGLKMLIRANEIFGTDDDALTERLTSAVPGTVFVHHECRRTFTDKRKLELASQTLNEENPKRSRRSGEQSFQWKIQCVLCGEQAVFDHRHPERVICEVRTLEIRERLLTLCENMHHPWCESVQMRVRNCYDLVAVEARYHKKCLALFSKVGEGHESSRGQGRPKADAMYDTFLRLCDWLNEGDAELYSLDELYEKMRELGDDVYSMKSFRRELQRFFGDHVYFAQIGGSRKDVVCFKEMSSFIISETWYNDRKISPDDESRRIITTAAKLVREEIRARDYTKDEYPVPGDMKNADAARSFLTPGLLTFLDTLISSELKRVGIGHAITQAVRPRSVMAPIIFGLGVELEHVFGSKWLLDQLYSLGFSISYDEASLFKQSVMQDDTEGSLVLPESDHCEYSADNADSNIATINGLGTFHGMGIIRWSRSTPNAQKTETRIRRRARISMSDLVDHKGIRIVTYVTSARPSLSTYRFEPIREMEAPLVIPPSVYYSNLLWRSTWMLQRTLAPTPDWTNWSGFMQDVFRSDDQSSIDHITILPLIDMNASDYNCLFSVICFVDNEIRSKKLPGTSLTFDQPLFVKAVEIVRAKEIKTVVIRLGGFHTLMSAVGGAFHLMQGSGVEEALGQVYGPNAVIHMMSGKAISRALRGIHLLDAALHSKLLELILPLELLHSDTESDGQSGGTAAVETEVERLSLEEGVELQTLLTEISTSDNPIDSMLHSVTLQRLDDKIQALVTWIAARSRTGKLWLQFIYHISLIKDFIQAERMKSWSAHLIACTKLLNLFAASGHLHYAKSVRLYVQMMRRLPEDHPWLYQMYMDDGRHAVQRTDHPLNGLWTDLIIEQVLMRSLKTRGGLTQGRGMTESIRHQWVYTMHQRAAIHDAMTTLTNKCRNTSEQHKDLGTTRRKQDGRDLCQMLCWINNHNPFDHEITELRSISTGLAAGVEDGVNCDDAERIGARIQTGLDGVFYTEAKIKRSQHARTLASLKPGVKIHGKTVFIEPSILFLRCCAIAQRLGDDNVQFFEHEMTAFPTSLFTDGFMRKANKSDLANAIQKNLTNHMNDEAQPKCMTVIDGGWLIHRMRWRNVGTYAEVVSDYVKFVNNHFGPSVVIFDGYTSSSTKDHEHARRSKTPSASFILQAHMPVQNQDSFLKNSSNKTQLVRLLDQALSDCHHAVKVCPGDADTTIVKEAISLARNGQSVQVVAEDTDVFIMLMYHWNPGMAPLFVKRVATRGTKGEQIRLLSIEDSVNHVTPQQKANILFIHAWSGSDSTSATFGHGKVQLLKKLEKSPEIQRLAQVISTVSSTRTEIGTAGKELFCQLYGDDTSDLTVLRHRRFQTMVAACKRLEPQRLPPTNRAAHFHALRVHLQTVQWTLLDEGALNPTDYGWENIAGELSPTMTDIEPAPDCILQFIRCKCKTGCRSTLCSCKKNGLKCVDACGGCHGQDCENRETVTIGDDDSDQE